MSVLAIGTVAFDTIETPFTSVAVIQNHDTRWTPEGIAARAHELFDESGISPEVENMMAKLRFTMTERSAL
mgnify:CR=1 FL=1